MAINRRAGAARSERFLGESSSTIDRYVAGERNSAWNSVEFGPRWDDEAICRVAARAELKKRATTNRATRDRFEFNAPRCSGFVIVASLDVESIAISRKLYLARGIALDRDFVRPLRQSCGASVLREIF